jgi:cytochrome b
MARAIRTPGPGAGEAVLVWDLPLRLFHWTLVLLFLAAWWTGSRENLFGLHEACGLALSGLLVFRVVWGFAGNRAARFASFLGGPRAVGAHLRDLLRGRLHPEPGHNPLGGWAVAVMLCLLLTEVVSGLFSSTFDYEGPLARLLPDSWTDSMAAIHAVNLDLLWGMIGLHLLGVVATSILGRENLVAAMITGRKRLAARPIGLGASREP